jgi:hypothetical protein
MTERETRIDDMNESKTRFISGENPFLPVDRDPRSLSRNVTDSVTSHRLCHVTLVFALRLAPAVALRMKWEAQDAAADVTAAIFFRPAACSGRRVFPRTAHEVEGVPHVVECTRATSSIRRPPAAGFTRSARTVCVALFYVINTGSTSTWARHHVTGWGVPIYTHHP